MDERRDTDPGNPDEGAPLGGEGAPLDADGAPLGGDETTEEQLDADNPAEEDTLKTLDPDAPPA